MPLIEYTEPRIHILRGNRANGMQVEFEFRPGALNEVPNDVWEHLKQFSVGCKQLLLEGKLKPVVVRTAIPASLKQVDGHVSDGVSDSDKYPPKKGKPTPVVSGKPPPEEAGEPAVVESVKDLDISTMTSIDAIALIDKVYDEATLKRFAGQENKRRGGPRVTVVKTLTKQTEVMKTDVTRSGSTMAQESSGE
jgi:hypothetical protein